MSGKLPVLIGGLALSLLAGFGCRLGAQREVEPTRERRGPLALAVEFREGETTTVALDRDASSEEALEVAFSEHHVELLERAIDEAAGKETFTFRALNAGVTKATFSRGQRVEATCRFAIGVDLAVANSLTEAEAREIAVAGECGAVGPLEETAHFNDWTATWYIAIDIEDEWCNPLCEIYVRQRRAEVNWQCTGIEPEE